MTYDSLSDLTSITDADNNTTQYSYGSAGNLLSITYPDGTQQSFTYDPLGNLTETIEQNGDPVSYQYNAQGLVTQEIFADGTGADLHLRRPRQPADGGDLRCQRHAHRHDHADLQRRQRADLDHLSRTACTSTSPTTPQGQRTQSVDQSGFTVNYSLRCARPAVRADRRLGQPDRPVHVQQPRRAGEKAQRQRHLHDLRLRRRRQPDQRGQLRRRWNRRSIPRSPTPTTCWTRMTSMTDAAGNVTTLRLRRHRPVDAGDAARRPDHHLRLQRGRRPHRGHQQRHDDQLLQQRRQRDHPGRLDDLTPTTPTATWPP